MTKTGVKIKGIVIGDDFRIVRTYTSLPVGGTIPMAWLTVKKSDKQSDAAALFQKEITGTLGPDGHITDNDTAGGTISMFFELTQADTGAAKPGLDYVYDIQVRTSDGDIHTLEIGTISFIRGVTNAIS